MRFFAQTDKVFDGDESASEGKNHIDGDEAPELKPCDGRAVDTEPHRLTDNDVRFGRDLIWKTLVKEVDDGKDGTCERHEGKDEKSPARPDVGKCLCDDIVQTAPTDEDEEQCRDAEGLKFELFIHWIELYCGSEKW